MGSSSKCHQVIGGILPHRSKLYGFLETNAKNWTEPIID